MSYQRIYVRPGISAYTGEPYRIWHPTQFRRPVPPEGGFVPNDPTFTGRAIRDGIWIPGEPPAAPSAQPAPVAAEAPAAPVEAPAPAPAAEPAPRRTRAAEKPPASE
jgi:hypothetical protein